MTARLFYPLASRGLVEIGGPDARTFLQSLITSEPPHEAGTARYAALLTPQGKVITDFFVLAADGGFLLDCPAARAADLTARLLKYRLRAKVSVTDRSADLCVTAITARPDRTGAGAICFPDPRSTRLGYRLVEHRSDQSAPDAEGFVAAGEPDYHRARIALGIPDADFDIPPETFFALDCNFDELGGVDFDKGCYVGQELTSRMKHRATARRRMLPVTAVGSLPAAGTPIVIGDLEIGEMCGSIGNAGMACIRLDRLRSASTARAGGTDITIGQPSYPLSARVEG